METVAFSHNEFVLTRGTNITCPLRGKHMFTRSAQLLTKKSWIDVRFRAKNAPKVRLFFNPLRVDTLQTFSERPHSVTKHTS